MKSALRGLNQTFGLACPIMWPAVTDCKAWGAPGPHGCNKKPGHDGRCQCACGRYEPSRTDHVECPTCGGDGIDGSDFAARFYAYSGKITACPDCTPENVGEPT